MSFAIFGNDYKALEPVQIREVTDYLTERNAEIYIEQLFYRALRKVFSGNLNIAGTFDGVNFDVDFAISMGGDGTFLQAASKVGAKETPIIGVNMGRLGFLANVSPTEIREMLDDIYKGNFSIDERSVIQMELEGEPVASNPYALNDIAILKRDNASMISIRASLDGEYLVTYLADGLVVSTPTGSTAYSLSNGGPILVPHTGTISLTPVAPHSLNIRPIVVSDDVVIRLEVESRSHNYLVAVDGRSGKLREGTVVVIRKAPFKVRIVKCRGYHYFATLRDKLMWGADTRERED
ncbi:NAD kinase [Prevotella dentasini JCM 15908]